MALSLDLLRRCAADRKPLASGRCSPCSPREYRSRRHRGRTAREDRALDLGAARVGDRLARELRSAARTHSRSDASFTRRSEWPEFAAQQVASKDTSNDRGDERTTVRRRRCLYAPATCDPPRPSRGAAGRNGDDVVVDVLRPGASAVASADVTCCAAARRIASHVSISLA